MTLSLKYLSKHLQANTLNHIHINKCNGETPVASNRLSAQTTFWRQHKHLSQRTETLGEGRPTVDQARQKPPQRRGVRGVDWHAAGY